MVRAKNGFSLIEMLVALGIGTVIMMTILSLLTMVSRENRSMSDKVESVDLERQLGLFMADDNLCGCQLAFATSGMKAEKSPTNGGNAYAVELSKLTSSCADPTLTFAVPGQKMAAISASFKVSRIAIRDLQQTGRKNPVTGAADEFTGSFFIEFDSSQNPTRALRGIKASKIFTTDPTGKTLVACSSANDFFQDQKMVTNPPSAVNIKSSVAPCPDGYRVVSGGWRSDGLPPTCPNSTNPASSVILENRPIVAADGRNGWLVKATCLTFQAISICQRGHK